MKDYEMKEYKFDVGEFAEGFPFHIKINTIQVLGYGSKPCPHILGKPFKHDYFGCGDMDKCFKIHRTIVARNEGGCNSTELCIDCLLDALKQIENGEIEPEPKEEV